MQYSKAQMIIRTLGLVTMITSPFWLLTLFFPENYESSSSLILIPLVVAGNFLLGFRISRNDRFLHSLLPVGILFKLAACGLYIYMIEHVLGQGDVTYYFKNGKEIASWYLATSQWNFWLPFSGTNAVINLSGLLQVLIGSSLSTASVVFGLFSFWGEYFTYRAFATAFPNGDRYLMGILAFFVPSIVFWTATIGKDALIMFFIGLAAYGFALLNSNPGLKAFVSLIVGLIGTMLLRPHMAAMLAISMSIPYLISTNRRGPAAVLGKMLGIVILGVGTYFLTTQASTFLHVDASLESAVTGINNQSRNSRFGDSAFGKDESFATRALFAPVLLFRPFFWEVHNVTSTFASIEGFLLLLFTWKRRRELLRILRRWRVDGFVAFLLVYTIQFSVVFSGAMSNFGLLARQRVMLLPFVLMMFCAICFSTPLAAPSPIRRSEQLEQPTAVPHRV